MSIRSILKSILPHFILEFVRKNLTIPTCVRKESNKWLRQHCRDIQGDVLSIGSANDSDGQGDFYRDYFIMASSYTTSECSGTFKCDLIVDVRCMSGIKDQSFDCIFCSGVLEHVDNYKAGLDEITRTLKTGGILLLGLPFRQAIHAGTQDFWRFTEYGIRWLLRESYEIIDLSPIGTRGRDFPVSYWVKAKKVM